MKAIAHSSSKSTAAVVAAAVCAGQWLSAIFLLSHLFSSCCCCCCKVKMFVRKEPDGVNLESGARVYTYFPWVCVWVSVSPLARSQHPGACRRHFVHLIQDVYLRLMIFQSSIFDGWHSIQTDRVATATAAADLLVHRCIYEIIDLIMYIENEYTFTPPYIR